MKIQELLTEGEQQVDEFLPALGAAAGALGRGALAAGSAVGRGAVAAGSALGRGALAASSAVGRGVQAVGRGALQGVAQAAAKQVAAQQEKSKELKVGGLYKHPTLGPLKILAISSTGITLDTTKQLGFPVTVDPKNIQQ